MSFAPHVNDVLVIDGVQFRIAEHPAAPGMPYGQQGRAATVYQLVEGDRRHALKVFNQRFRVPAMAGLAERLAPFSRLPGLTVCSRSVLTALRQKALVAENPDLSYATLMPWIEGPTWFEVLLDTERGLPTQKSLELALSLARVLAGMEENGIAHCDLSGPNLLLPALATGAGSEHAAALNPVELVDLEQLYAPGFRPPDLVPSGSGGYAHRTAAEGLWSANADRFAGATIILEMLCWSDPRFRSASYGESYFAPDELQQPGTRYDTLVGVLRDTWGNSLVHLLERLWASDTLSDCPTFSDWLAALPDNLALSSGTGVQAGPVASTKAPAPAPAPPPTQPARLPYAAPPVPTPPATPAGGGAPPSARMPQLLDEARRLEAAGDLPAALQVYRDAISIAPAGSSLAAELSLISQNIERRIRASVPAPPPTDSELLPTFEAGLEAYNRGNWAQAEELLAEVVRQRPDFAVGDRRAALLLADARKHLGATAPDAQQPPTGQPGPEAPQATSPLPAYTQPPQPQPYTAPPAQPYAPQTQPYPQQTYAQQAYPQQPYSQQPYPQPYYPQQAPPAPARRSGVSPLIIFLVGLVVVIIACVGSVYVFILRPVGTAIGDLGSSLSATATAIAGELGVSDASSGGKSGPTAVPVSRPLSSTTPPKFTYANLEFTVTKGMITNERTARFSPDKAEMNLTLSVTNPTKDYIQVSTGLLQVKSPNGTVLHKEEFSQAVQARDTQEFSIRFTVPLTTTWQGAQLTLDEIGKHPASLSLDGSAQQSGYPRKLPSAGAADMKKPKFRYEVKDATIDLDGMGRRAPLDKEYLLLTILVSSSEQVANGYVGSENFTLIVDGIPMRAERLSPAAVALDPLEKQEFQLAFLIPVNAQHAELEVGEVNGETAKLPIDLQGAKRP